MTAVPFEQPRFDHVAQLAALGLKAEYLYDALRADEAERRSSTPLEPVNAAGTRGYFARVRTFREATLLNEGWIPKTRKGLELTVNPEKTIGIAVALGDENTGRPGYPQPRTRRAAGQVKTDLMLLNAQPLFELPESDPDVPQELDDDEYARMKLLIFLSYREVRKDKVLIHSELSRPQNWDGSGRIDFWDYRITMPVLELNNVIEYTEEGPDDYNVDVEEL